MQTALACGADNHYLAVFSIGLGTTLHSLGRLEEAAATIGSALAMLHNLFGDQDQRHVAAGTLALGRVQRAQGHLEPALAAFQASLTMFTRLQAGGDNVSGLRAARKVAEALLALGRPADAVPHARAAVDMAGRMCLSENAHNGLRRKSEAVLAACTRACDSGEAQATRARGVPVT
jgi:tetratricopeptide (TPR) repeat protein